MSTRPFKPVRRLSHALAMAVVFVLAGAACIAAPSAAAGTAASAAAPAAPAAATSAAAATATPFVADPGADPLRGGRPLLIGVQRFAAPFAFEKAPGDFRGYSVDLCLRLVELLRHSRGWDFVRERDVRFVPVTSRTRMLLLLSGEIDMECGSTSNTPQRRELGITFSPTIFVSEVAALLAPQLARGSSSLDPFLQQLRQARLPLVTTEGSTSVGHIRALSELAASDLKVILGSDHEDSLRRLREAKAGAFVMDRALLATMLKRNPPLLKQGFALSSWSPAPGKLECYGVMTRGRVFGMFGLPLRAQLETMRSNGELHALYRKWFQTPLPVEDRVPGLPAGQALGLGMLPQHEMLLLDPLTRPCGEQAL